MTRPTQLANFSLDPAFAGQNTAVPFHGDQYTIDYICKYIEQADAFVETGTCFADTFYHIVSNFKDKTCISCEPDTNRYDLIKGLFNETDTPNATLLPVTSVETIDWIETNMPDLKEKKVVFWLDAHGEWTENGERKFSWPLKEEVSYITSNYKNYAIFIDDFFNPFNRNHKYDVYMDSIICGPEEVVDYLNGARMYHHQFDKVTSRLQPFMVGIGLITDMELLPTDNDMTLIESTGVNKYFGQDTDKIDYEQVRQSYDNMVKYSLV